jgi:drug/metabolite transporter (DMT)-like permease
VPIFGVVFSALLLDETPSPALLVGGALVIASLMVLARSTPD